MKTFQDLIMWQKAHRVVLNVYEFTKGFPNEEKFGLTSQIRRASVSIASNVVEGFKRRSKKEALYFYIIAEGSLEEVKYQLLLAKDLDYLSPEKYKSWLNERNSC